MANQVGVDVGKMMVDGACAGGMLKGWGGGRGWSRGSGKLGGGCVLEMGFFCGTVG